MSFFSNDKSIAMKYTPTEQIKNVYIALSCIEMTEGYIPGGRMEKAVIIMCVAAISVLAVDAPGFIMEHGKYSAAYMSDWANMGTGKAIAKKDIRAVRFSDVDGMKAKERFEEMPAVYLTNRAVRVSWDVPADKYKTTMYYIRECKSVVVDNVYVVQKNAKNAGSHDVFIEDCDVVVVRNSYFAGALSQVHLRIENCGYVFIDGVEIAGIDYEGNGLFRNGIGIFIEGGQMDASGKLYRRYSTNARDIQWLTLQNCYIHDYTFGDTWENKDGIQIHSAPNGILFNNYIENWDMKYADGAMDVSHRRTDISDRVLRIERTIVKNCTLTKSPGTGTSDDAIVWVNNIFFNVFHGDYHHTWRQVFLHNTWIYDTPTANIHYKLWDFTGPAYIINSLVVASNPISMVFQNADQGTEKYRSFHPENNVYSLSQNAPWLFGVRKESFTFEEWRAQGKDAGSTLTREGGSAITVNGDVYTIASQTPSTVPDDHVRTNDVRYRAAHDFFGKKRSSRPTAGAIEAR